MSDRKMQLENMYFDRLIPLRNLFKSRAQVENFTDSGIDEDGKEWTFVDYEGQITADKQLFRILRIINKVAVRMEYI